MLSTVWLFSVGYTCKVSNWGQTKSWLVIDFQCPSNGICSFWKHEWGGDARERAVPAYPSRLAASLLLKMFGRVWFKWVGMQPDNRLENSHHLLSDPYHLPAKWNDTFLPWFFSFRWRKKKDIVEERADLVTHYCKHPSQQIPPTVFNYQKGCVCVCVKCDRPCDGVCVCVLACPSYCIGEGGE